MRLLKLDIPEKKIKREFEIIQQGKPNGYDTLYSWNECILHFQWEEFYKQELKLWYENKPRHGVPLQSWIYLNRKKYIDKDALSLTDRDILRAFKITGIHIGNSMHSPFYIQQFIKDYNIKSIYDPCGGWGHRLLGAKAMGIDYIYNDINTTTVNNCKRMAEYFNLDVTFYNQDAALPILEDYDAVFTCPPYYNVEIYSEDGAENLSYSQFLSWWSSIISHFKGKYFAFVINHTYKQDMLGICLAHGLTLIDDIKLGKQSYSHLNADSRTAGIKGEFLVILSNL